MNDTTVNKMLGGRGGTCQGTPLRCLMVGQLALVSLHEVCALGARPGVVTGEVNNVSRRRVLAPGISASSREAAGSRATEGHTARDHGTKRLKEDNRSVLRSVARGRLTPSSPAETWMCDRV